jgi:hypothetical protein
MWKGWQEVQEFWSGRNMMLEASHFV